MSSHYSKTVLVALCLIASVYMFASIGTDNSTEFAFQSSFTTVGDGGCFMTDATSPFSADEEFPGEVIEQCQGISENCERPAEAYTNFYVVFEDEGMLIYGLNSEQRRLSWFGFEVKPNRVKKLEYVAGIIYPYVAGYFSKLGHYARCWLRCGTNKLWWPINVGNVPDLGAR